MPNVRLRDIARHTKVSIGTVSKVLNGQWQAHRVGAETAERVQKAATSLGYRPIQAARSTRTGRTGMYCLLVDPHLRRSALPRPLLDGLHAAASALGLRLAYTQIADDGLSAELAVRACDAWIVNYHGALPTGLEAALAATGQPCVWLGRDDRPDALSGDEGGAARALVEGLLARGRRRIPLLLPSLVRGNESALGPAFRARLAGWRQALSAAGLPAVLAQQAPLAHAELRQWVAEASRDADGLLLHDASPSLLAGVAGAFAHLPTDAWPELACVSPVEQCAGLPVHTVRLPWAELGRAAIALLERRLAGGAPEPARYLPFTIEEPQR